MNGEQKVQHVSKNCVCQHLVKPVLGFTAKSEYSSSQRDSIHARHARMNASRERIQKLVLPNYIEHPETQSLQPSSQFLIVRIKDRVVNPSSGAETSPTRVANTSTPSPSPSLSKPSMERRQSFRLTSPLSSSPLSPNGATVDHGTIHSPSSHDASVGVADGPTRTPSNSFSKSPSPPPRTEWKVIKELLIIIIPSDVPSIGHTSPSPASQVSIHSGGADDDISFYEEDQLVSQKRKTDIESMFSPHASTVFALNADNHSTSVHEDGEANGEYSPRCDVSPVSHHTLERNSKLHIIPVARNKITPRLSPETGSEASVVEVIPKVYSSSLGDNISELFSVSSHPETSSPSLPEDGTAAPIPDAFDDIADSQRQSETKCVTLRRRSISTNSELISHLSKDHSRSASPQKVNTILISTEVQTPSVHSKENDMQSTSEAEPRMSDQLNTEPTEEESQEIHTPTPLDSTADSHLVRMTSDQFIQVDIPPYVLEKIANKPPPLKKNASIVHLLQEIDLEERLAENLLDQLPPNMPFKRLGGSTKALAHFVSLLSVDEEFEQIRLSTMRDVSTNTQEDSEIPHSDTIESLNKDIEEEDADTESLLNTSRYSAAPSIASFVELLDEDDDTDEESVQHEEEHGSSDETEKIESHSNTPSLHCLPLDLPNPSADLIICKTERETRTKSQCDCVTSEEDDFPTCVATQEFEKTTVSDATSVDGITKLDDAAQMAQEDETDNESEESEEGLSSSIKQKSAQPERGQQHVPLLHRESAENVQLLESEDSTLVRLVSPLREKEEHPQGLQEQTQQQRLKLLLSSDYADSCRSPQYADELEVQSDLLSELDVGSEVPSIQSMQYVANRSTQRQSLEVGNQHCSVWSEPAEEQPSSSPQHERKRIARSSRASVKSGGTNSVFQDSANHHQESRSGAMEPSIFVGSESTSTYLQLHERRKKLKATVS